MTMKKEFKMKPYKKVRIRHTHRSPKQARWAVLLYSALAKEIGTRYWTNILGIDDSRQLSEKNNLSNEYKLAHNTGWEWYDFSDRRIRQYQRMARMGLCKLRQKASHHRIQVKLTSIDKVGAEVMLHLL